MDVLAKIEQTKQWLAEAKTLDKIRYIYKSKQRVVWWRHHV